jgi:predicted transcriptional regulator
MKQENVETIKKLHEEGKKNVEIAKQLEIDRCTVAYYLNDEFQYALYTPNQNKRWELKEYNPSSQDLGYRALLQ